MKHRTSFHLATLVSLAWLALSCGSSWNVTRQAIPNPFHGRPTFVVAPVSFDGLMIDSHNPIAEVVYLERKTPEQQASWQGDKAGLAQSLTGSLLRDARGFAAFLPRTDPASAGAFIISARVTMIEIGSFFRQPEARMVVQVLTPQGTVLDEIGFTAQPNMGIVYPIADKLRSMGDILGSQLAGYLRRRREH